LFIVLESERPTLAIIAFRVTLFCLWEYA